MRCLIVYAHPDPDSLSAALRHAASTSLLSAGHTVDVIDLYDIDYPAALTGPELTEYLTIAEDHPDPVVAEHLSLLGQADALILVFPTWWSGMPAILKGWLDRTLLPGVAFSLSPSSKRLAPELNNIRRIIGITTTGSSRQSVWLTGNPGRRTIHRTLRLLCHKRCRRTWLSLPKLDSTTAEDRQTFINTVSNTMAEL